MKVKTDQQIRAQTDTFPSHEQKQVVIRQDERKHRKHEQVHVSEESVITAFVRHVTNGVNVNQHAHAGNEKQPDGRERIEQEPGVGVERGERPVALNEVQMPVAAAQPCINNLLERMPRSEEHTSELQSRQ